MKHAYLLHTGYGKTKLCLDKIINAPRKPRTLLISTKNIVESAWPAEIQKWYPGKITYNFITGKIPPEKRLDIVNQPVDILGMNTEMIDWYIKNTTKVNKKTYTKQGIKEHHDTDELITRFNLIIIDEVSLFKNSQSERFKHIKKWCHRVTNVMVLSATPTPKDIEDIWAPIFLLDGGQRLGKTITKFREDYAIAVPLPNGQNRYQYSQASTDYVLSLIKDISTSIPAPAQALFPEPVLKKTLIKPDAQTQETLEKFKSDYILKLTGGKNIIAFSKTQMINKISQIASGDVYTTDTIVHMNDIKFRYLKLLLDTIKTPVLIFYNYIFDKDKLLTLPGARLLSNKQDFEDWNNNKIPIGILSPFSAAHGLNLQDSDCQDLIWFSPIWDTEKWIQTNARVCRRGQKRPVIIRVLLLKGSYDEYAFDLCQDKFRAQYNNLQKLR
jgi:hypothetical protein